MISFKVRTEFTVVIVVTVVIIMTLVTVVIIVTEGTVGIKGTVVTVVTVVMFVKLVEVVTFKSSTVYSQSVNIVPLFHFIVFNDNAYKQFFYSISPPELIQNIDFKMVGFWGYTD